MPIEIEIYLPCRPEAVCSVILVAIVVLFVVGLLLFVRVVWKEYMDIKQFPKPVRQRRKRKKEK